MTAPEIITFGCRLNAYESEVMRDLAAGSDGDPFCEDTSKFCTLLVKSPGLCAADNYREQCCRTCTRGG